MRLFRILLLVAVGGGLTGARAQEMRTGTPEADRKDPLGFGLLTKDRPKGSKTEISAQKEATFNDKDSRATFVGEVRVKDAAFMLSADRLTVFLNKNRSGIDRAVADGNVVIVQQTDGKEEGAIGRARRAEYVPSTGVVTLIGWPEVQQGINRHIAASESTRMILNRDGRATTEGASRTVITDTEGMSGRP
jgi:lipopolysaccharide transport protein LptA